jgi:hypothetical protein
MMANSQHLGVVTAELRLDNQSLFVRVYRWRTDEADT